RFSAHGSEGDDLADVLTAVLIRNVANDLAAASHAEVDVDVREADPFGVQKALKNQVVLKRIDVRDTQRVGRQAAGCRTPPRTHGNALLAGMPDEIPDDQEVAGEAHLLDQFDLPLQSFFIGLERITQSSRCRRLLQPLAPMRKPLPCYLLEEAVERLAGRNLEMRKDVLFLLQVYVTALGNFQGARKRFRRLTEDRLHFLKRLEIELVGGELHPVRIAEGFPGLNADQNVLSARIRFREVMTIVGGYKGYASVAC